jgi:hypothetical protein
VAAKQDRLDDDALQRWAQSAGLGVTLFYDWYTLVQQALFWGTLPQPTAAQYAAERIRERLVGVEAAPASVLRWEALVSGLQEGEQTLA